MVSIGGGAPRGVQVVDKVNDFWLPQARNHWRSRPRAVRRLLLLLLFRPTPLLFLLPFSWLFLKLYRLAEHEQTGAKIRSEIGYVLFVDETEATCVGGRVQRHIHYH